MSVLTLLLLCVESEETWGPFLHRLLDLLLLSGSLRWHLWIHLLLELCLLCLLAGLGSYLLQCNNCQIHFLPIGTLGTLMAPVSGTVC